MMLIAFQSSPMRSLPDCRRAELQFDDVVMRKNPARLGNGRLTLVPGIRELSLARDNSARHDAIRPKPMLYRKESEP
jgi:hypothetical protein